MEQLPNCPKCNSEYTYEDGSLLVCPECAYEWSASEANAAEEANVIKDANGNVLQDGDIIESHFVVTRRNRTIHKRMREYLYELTHRDDLVTAVLPIGDGITVSSKK